MKNSKLVKIVLIIIMSLAIIIATKSSFAVTSLTDGSLTGTSTTGNSITSGTSGNSISSGTSGNSISSGTTGNSISSGTSGNSISSGTSGNSISSGTSGNSITQKNTVLTTSNTSRYNNNSLPKTGVEDSMPIVVLAVVLGISSVYAYKKIQDYKNI